MNEKEAALIKVLADLNDQPELSDEQEHLYRYATDEEYRFQYDVEHLCKSK